ncbi:hypothetical protein BJ912DRAFT_438579 [Pholiota molesta]|nr:hypothetical protein BJ912DRAFT_438579 [Pholiota molesta]
MFVSMRTPLSLSGSLFIIIALPYNTLLTTIMCFHPLSISISFSIILSSNHAIHHTPSFLTVFVPCYPSSRFHFL